MTFFNATAFACLDVPALSPDGREVVVAIAKATFVLTPEGPVRAPRQRPVRLADDVHHPSAEDSSVRLPADVGLGKRGADVVVVGSAVSPQPVASLVVGVVVGAHLAQLRVHGERLYFRGAAGEVRIGDAAPFIDKPVVYERAYGGTSADKSKVERRNPVGRGVANDAAELLETPAPQIERLAEPIHSALDRPPPAGFGAIPCHWAPRADFFGTIDAAYLRDRLPLPPADHDPRFHNVAHPDLVLPAHLAPGTQVRVVGMSSAPVAFAIPDVRLSAVARFDDGSLERIAMPLDLLLIDLTSRAEHVAELGARACVALGRGRKKLRELRVEPGGAG